MNTVTAGVTPLRAKGPAVWLDMDQKDLASGDGQDMECPGWLQSDDARGLNQRNP